jgi:hypothetical protein
LLLPVRENGYRQGEVRNAKYPYFFADDHGDRLVVCRGVVLMGRSSFRKDSVDANRDTTRNTSAARDLMIKRVQTLEEQPCLYAGRGYVTGKGPSGPFRYRTWI